MARLSVLLIRLYRRFVSPHKGFRCAASVLYDVPSCSNSVEALLEQRGLFGSITGIGATFRCCRAAARVLELQRSLGSLASEEKSDTADDEESGRKKDSNDCFWHTCDAGGASFEVLSCASKKKSGLCSDGCDLIPDCAPCA